MGHIPGVVLGGIILAALPKFCAMKGKISAIANMTSKPV
jgi:hypothetical protein